MSLSKTAEQAMQYEKTGSKKVDGKATSIRIASNLHTTTLIWLLVKRHKVGLLAIGNIVLVLNWVFPLWPQLLLGLIGK